MSAELISTVRQGLGDILSHMPHARHRGKSRRHKASSHIMCVCVLHLWCLESESLCVAVAQQHIVCASTLKVFKTTSSLQTGMPALSAHGAALRT